MHKYYIIINKKKNRIEIKLIFLKKFYSKKSYILLEKGFLKKKRIKKDDCWIFLHGEYIFLYILF